VTLKGTVTPTSLAGSKITLRSQRKSGTLWYIVTSLTATITSSGTYSKTYKPTVKATFRVQASIGATSSHAAASTAWQSFIVK
jgi:hypothetical protein